MVVLEPVLFAIVMEQLTYPKVAASLSNILIISSVRVISCDPPIKFVYRPSLIPQTYDVLKEIASVETSEHIAVDPAVISAPCFIVVSMLALA